MIYSNIIIINSDGVLSEAKFIENAELTINGNSLMYYPLKPDIVYVSSYILIWALSSSVVSEREGVCLWEKMKREEESSKKVI